MRRTDAEYLVWSAVHGLALLLTDGPLRGMHATAISALEQQLPDMVERGL
ncbi:hypothetical protein [Variovorax sp. E3]|nr:hypothetical protein [Variovorax sp. E3]